MLTDGISSSSHKICPNENLLPLQEFHGKRLRTFFSLSRCMCICSRHLSKHLTRLTLKVRKTMKPLMVDSSLSTTSKKNARWMLNLIQVPLFIKHPRLFPCFIIALLPPRSWPQLRQIYSSISLTLSYNLACPILRGVPGQSPSIKCSKRCNCRRTGTDPSDASQSKRGFVIRFM